MRILFLYINLVIIEELPGLLFEAVMVPLVFVGGKMESSTKII